MEKFCGKCGAELNNGVCPKCGQNASITTDDLERKIKRFFMSQNEKMVAILGKVNSEEYLKRGKCSGGFAVLSDKRLYSFSGSYDICNTMFGRKQPRGSKQSRTIDLIDIKGTGDGIYHKRLWRVMAIVHFAFVIIGIILFVLGLKHFNELPHQVSTGLFAYLIVFIPILFIFALIYLIIYLFSKYHMLTIQYNGGEIAFDMAYFTAKEMDFFQRQLRLAKDKVAENNIEKSALKVTASPVDKSVSYNSKADELAKLAELLSKGVISREEFEKMKGELI